MKKFFATLTFSLVLCSTLFAYTMSDAGKQAIMDAESCVLTAYWDSNGYSIGWGHHGSDVYKGMKISKAQAKKYFNQDIKSVEAAANRMLKNFKCTFSQGFFDGLCDLIYNCGEAGVKKSEFWNRLNRCRIKNGKMNETDLSFTIAAVKSCRISCAGHKDRRYATHKMMLN